MAAAQKLYPRATLKKIVKAHSKRSLTKNVDILIFLDYALFLQTLMKEAGINAKQAGERGISARSVKKVTESMDGDGYGAQELAVYKAIEVVMNRAKWVIRKARHHLTNTYSADRVVSGRTDNRSRWLGTHPPATTVETLPHGEE
ncbi:uncharacterized protein BP5553_02824 [Venustampulla echinocandica]|uniref:Transcription factor CBF/NF-Y/archaeal histone domain-containing protein n=1 Tax=Venustampulla echinocandica TaxID=2656787 RepID=A0A370TSK3_9HELO|nr:uncharacterized protein BP5553_02824 [Venustampulla echinocandica]RDL38484.1 hypothetical protein BP5553_02824 [Venustampulla echinocandica]